MNHPLYSEQNAIARDDCSLSKTYDLGDPSNINRVYTFLDQQPKLSAFLTDAHLQLRQFFPNEILKLDYVSDPELPSLEQLFIRIENQQDIDHTLEQLQNMDETWWLDVPQEISSNLCITLDV